MAAPLITKRKTEMIVLSSGKKISPEELEEFYLQSPYIKEICVIGITGEHDEAEKLHAVVVPDFDYLKEQRVVNSRPIVRHEMERIAGKLPPRERVLSYEVQANPLPRTATGKPMRCAIRDRIESRRNREQWRQTRDYGRMEGDDLLLERESSRRVMEILKSGSGLDGALNPDMNLELDLGFDSLQRVELIATVERSLDARFSRDAAGRFLTVRDLLKGVQEAVAAGPSAAGRGAVAEPATWKEILDNPEKDVVPQKHVLKLNPLIDLPVFIIVRLFLWASRILFRLEVKGVENLPRQGPYLICSNHQSYLDGAILCSTLPYYVASRFVFLGWTPFFSGGIKNVIGRVCRAIPIDPDANLLRAMKVSVIALRAEKILLIYPEGGLTVDGELKTFKKGVSILVRELKVPIVPVAINGSFDVWSKVSKRIRLAKVKVTFGKLWDIDSETPALDDPHDDYANLAKKIEDEVKRLLDDGPGVA